MTLGVSLGPPASCSRVEDLMSPLSWSEAPDGAVEVFMELPWELTVVVSFRGSARPAEPSTGELLTSGGPLPLPVPLPVMSCPCQQCQKASDVQGSY